MQEAQALDILLTDQNRETQGDNQLLLPDTNLNSLRELTQTDRELATFNYSDEERQAVQWLNIKPSVQKQLVSSTRYDSNFRRKINFLL
jgi:hypothetical protein